MNAKAIIRVLEEAQQSGARVAVGFADRSFFIESIQNFRTHDVSDGDTLFEVAGMVYDTGHSRHATPERAFFQSEAVVSLAIPAAAS